MRNLRVSHALRRLNNSLKSSACALTVGLAILFSAPAAMAADGDFLHVRLKDRLDRPDDGYCFDILGTSRALRPDLPLFAHNCKGGPTADSVVTYSSEEQLIFPAAKVCVTAFGVNNTVLPGTSVLLRPCDEQTPFFDGTNLQKFEHTAEGQLKLRGSDLCLTVGAESSPTYSPHDRWRVLSLESCQDVAPKLSLWDLVPLN